MNRFGCSQVRQNKVRAERWWWLVRRCWGEHGGAVVEQGRWQGLRVGVNGGGGKVRREVGEGCGGRRRRCKNRGEGREIVVETRRHWEGARRCSGGGWGLGWRRWRGRKKGARVVVVGGGAGGGVVGAGRGGGAAVVERGGREGREERREGGGCRSGFWVVGGGAVVAVVGAGWLGAVVVVAEEGGSCREEKKNGGL
ncbi:glycine-rich cell wall structural protein 1.8-like [Arachis ipaensis]|uniref:glycine-rich cell wall structural protein 1.8-like n=1 Tax=Arachis ipaensis TaxID=130454 RepID=UPI0007AF1052|nr:glycine-rich cell wall structural protein 1.8-like [Arachis ipaensis]